MFNPLTIQRTLFRTLVSVSVASATLTFDAAINLKIASAVSFIPGEMPGTVESTLPLISPLQASSGLTPSFQFQGKGNWSLDAVGSNNTPVGTIQALVPQGSFVEKAFLYSSLTPFVNPNNSPIVVFDGVNYDDDDFIPLGANNIGLQAWRADVTDQVRSKVGSGSTIPFDFLVNSESPNSNIDGEVLAIIYSNPTEEERTIAILDGFTPTTGNTTNVNLAEPIDLTKPGFEALLSLGIGFGFQPSNQFSLVDINGKRLTSSAGGQDDGLGQNGALITVGGLGDSSTNPDPLATPSTPRTDDELYNLAEGFLNQGDTSFIIDTINPSNDDNIFFVGLNITAEASFNGPDVPEPGMIFGLLTFGGLSLLAKGKQQV